MTPETELNLMTGRTNSRSGDSFELTQHQPRPKHRHSLSASSASRFETIPAQAFALMTARNHRPNFSITL